MRTVAEVPTSLCWKIRERISAAKRSLWHFRMVSMRLCGGMHTTGGPDTTDCLI